MRLLAIFLVVPFGACASKSGDAPGVNPSTKCPVGDGINVSVYGFLEAEIVAASAGDDSRANTRAELAREAELLKQPDMKPPRASIVEAELSHALTTLCAGSPGCKAIGLYTKHGLAIALSSLSSDIAPLGFADDARWAALSSAPPDGALFELRAEEAGKLDRKRHALSAFTVERGVALCIVER